ncbi:MAG: hypothetical protein ABIA37_01475, partial [Candidatus Woesearchaeota archaeon]
ADSLVDCNDPMCTYTPMCSGNFGFTSSGSDTTSPNVIFQKVETFHDGAFVKFDTNEPANGTVFFYYNNSGCTQLNKTIYDIGDAYCTGDWCSYDDYKLWHDAPIDNFNMNYYQLGYDLNNSTTYYYKYKVCDPSGNCAVSACSNFTTKTTMQSFFFDMTPPSGFTVKTPWAQGGQSYAQQVNSSATKNINVTVECSDAGYSLTLVGVDIKSAKTIDFSDFICSASSNLVGMPSSKWNQLLSDLSVDWVEIIWTISGTSPVIYHCDEDGVTGCTDVTTYLECTSTATTLTCKIPTTLGFSTYKVTTTTSSTPSGGSSGGGGGGGGSFAATYTLTGEQLQAGYAEKLKAGDKFKVMLSETEYYVTLKEVNSGSVKISSGSQELFLLSGQIGKFELTGDNYYDVAVTVGEINFTGNNSQLTIKSISELMVTQAVPENVLAEEVTAEAIPEAAPGGNELTGAVIAGQLEEEGRMLWPWMILGVIVVGAILIYLFWEKKN